MFLKPFNKLAGRVLSGLKPLGFASWLYTPIKHSCSFIKHYIRTHDTLAKIICLACCVAIELELAINILCNDRLKKRKKIGCSNKKLLVPAESAENTYIARLVATLSSEIFGLSTPVFPSHHQSKFDFICSLPPGRLLEERI